MAETILLETINHAGMSSGVAAVIARSRGYELEAPSAPKVDVRAPDDSFDLPSSLSGAIGGAGGLFG